MTFFALIFVGPKEWCRYLSMKSKGFDNHRGLEDVNIAIKHVSSLSSGYCKVIFGQRGVLTISVFVLPVSAHKNIRNV